MKTYLGQKGYTISKSDLTVEQQKKIKNELMIKPFVMSTVGGSGSDDLFPVYRESTSKMYLPHYYGIAHFGAPSSYKINQGVDLPDSIQFQGTLRELQQTVVNSYLNHIKGKPVSGGLIQLPCGQGKTILALNIISQIKKKTFIIVHKEFLMNQWIERIQQFLPTAKVGKIQGQVIDIEGKDIVIGMLQSLSMKEYPASVFESFGLTIIDEVHHISSQTFSNALFKVVTKYMLGLSATMTRKDGTTPVFKMFLGEIIYIGKREETHNVIVRAIEYKVDDDEFNEVKTDYRGNVAYSSMISKLCEYNRRTEFILRVITDMIAENPAQQIMVLAHNKNILKYLYDAIIFRKLSEVGYYVGGMKESALKSSERKAVILATYSMASEALDIKSLTTLIMATPKTDIEQSVGRILREKHKDTDPIIVDIIDTHDPFKNQWKKRKAFYKKENYTIIQTNSANYTADTSKWSIICRTDALPLGAKKERRCKIESSDSDSDSDSDSGPSRKKGILQGKCLLTL
jgi:superfamily II DNA or RNA helicase